MQASVDFLDSSQVGWVISLGGGLIRYFLVYGWLFGSFFGGLFPYTPG